MNNENYVKMERIKTSMPETQNIKACRVNEIYTFKTVVFMMLTAMKPPNVHPFSYCVCVCVCVLQKGLDREFFLLFSVMDENMSWYLKENIEMFGSTDTNPLGEDFEESNLMHGKSMCGFTSLHVFD